MCTFLSTLKSASPFLSAVILFSSFFSTYFFHHFQETQTYMPQNDFDMPKNHLVKFQKQWDMGKAPPPPFFSLKITTFSRERPLCSFNNVLQAMAFTVIVPLIYFWQNSCLKC